MLSIESRLMDTLKSYGIFNSLKIFSNSKWLFDIGLTLICLIGTIWQIIYICQMYFAYPTTVVVTLEIPEFVEIPGVTICQHIRGSLDKVKLKGRDAFRLTNKSAYDFDQLGFSAD